MSGIYTSFIMGSRLFTADKIFYLIVSLLHLYTYLYALSKVSHLFLRRPC